MTNRSSKCRVVSGYFRRHCRQTVLRMEGQVILLKEKLIRNTASRFRRLKWRQIQPSQNIVILMGAKVNEKSIVAKVITFVLLSFDIRRIG